MAVLLPSFPQSPDTIFEVELSGVTYNGRLTFRGRVAGGSWYLDLADADGAPIVQGRRVSPGAPPLAGVVDDRIPPGSLTAIGHDPYARAELGGEVAVVYLTPDEIPEPTPTPYTVS